MRKFYVFLAIVLLPIAHTLYAQNIIEKYYQHYADLEKSTVVHVSALSFQYAAQILPDNEEEKKELKEFLASVSSFDLIRVPEVSDPKGEYNSAISKLGNEYDELLKVKDQEHLFSVHIDEQDGVIYELVGVAAEKDGFILFSLLGEMRLEQIGKMIEKIQSDKLEPLKEISETGAVEWRAYPNPVNSQGAITLEIPDQMKGGHALLMDASGVMLKEIRDISAENRFEMDGLTPGYYFITLEKDGVQLKKKILVVR